MKSTLCIFIGLALSTAALAEPAPTNESTSTVVGGYGEINYNRYSKSPERTRADVRRFIMSLSRQFNDQLSFNGEVEIEHAVASAGDVGEVALEQAVLNYQLSSAVNLKAGLFLMPFGFLNLTHEPPMYFGVERNEIETRIIPSTWREGGLGLYGSTAMGLSWDAGVVTGFDVTKEAEPGGPLAGIQQELSEARAQDLSFYLALNYAGLPGHTVGAAAFTGDATQGNAAYKGADPANLPPDFGGIKGRVTLWDVHTRWSAYGLDLQALYAMGSIGEAGKINDSIATYNVLPGNSPREFQPEQFYGWFLQGAYTVWERGDKTLTPFLRYEQFNTQSKMPTGYAADALNADRVWTVGLSFKPHPQVVFKTDYRKYADNAYSDRFNLGMGYMF